MERAAIRFIHFDQQDPQNGVALLNGLQKFIESQEVLPGLRFAMRATLVKVSNI
jgi:hypothetical protein